MNWDGLGNPTFAGADNWTRILTDPVTQNAMKLSLMLTIATWVTQFPTSLLLGVFMAGKQRYREGYSILYFLPLLFSSAAVGIAFKALLDPNFGLGSALGIDALNKDWLGDPNLSMPTLVFVIAWSFVPFHSLLYQGAARQLPDSVYEAAMIDGAGRVATFFNITVPMLRSTIITSSTLMIVGSLTYFDLIFVMTARRPRQRHPDPAARHVPARLPLLRHGRRERRRRDPRRRRRRGLLRPQPSLRKHQDGQHPGRRLTWHRPAPTPDPTSSAAPSAACGC